ncbi:MAG: class F sortase [Hyphomicrobiales bacterium]
MKILRVLAIVSFLAGLSLLVAGFVANQDDSDSRADAAPPEFTSTPTPTPGDVETPTPTPTPPPYDGGVTRFIIPKLNVDSLVETIGLLPDNRLDTPHNPHNTGWYDIEGYGKPGFGGNSVFSAHVDYWPDIRGPFHDIRNLVPGDEVIVQMDNGLQYHYRVISYHRYDVNNIPMGDLIWPKERPENVEWITMITCGGRFVQTQDSGAGEYLDRDVVVAERFEP